MRIVQFSRLKLALSFLFIMAMGGCYSPERNLSLDPQNKPLVHILNSGYDTATSSVIIQWEYIGTEAVTVFEVRRRIASDFEVVARIDGNQESPSYALVRTYQDNALIAGEPVFYQVVAELSGGGRELTQTASVTVPGAQAIGVVRDPVGLSVQFRWRPDPSIGVGYQIFRAVGTQTPEMIFESDDANLSSYLDQDITTNAPYHYQVFTRTQNGALLKSRSVAAHFYKQATTQPVENVRVETEALRLSVGEPSVSGGTLALIARSGQVALYQFRYQIGLAFDGSPRILRTLVGIVFPSVTDLIPKSVDFAGPLGLSANSVFPRVYLGGIREDGQVDVQGFEMPLFNRVWRLPNPWFVPAGATRVALARDGSGQVYAGVGNEIRVYSEFGSFVGAQTVPGVVRDLSVSSSQLWVLLDDGTLLKGVLIFESGALLPVSWVPVTLPTSVGAVALSHNSLGQTLVLDANNRQLLMLQSNGDIGLNIPVTGADFSSGDLVVDQSAGNLVQVTDGRGDITTFIP